MNAFSWLESLSNFERKLPGKYGVKTFSLDRYRTLLARLGNPQVSNIPTVHILGTDGKGSTLAFLEALLSLSGRRTKAFISPHLVSVEERFRHCGESIGTPLLHSVLERVLSVASGDAALTYFEVLNAAFWVWAREEPPDYVLLETGLGGRLDTTSVCEPALKILTRLERDHTRLLGKTMETISGEKLAALVPSCPVVVAPQAPFLMDRLRHFSVEKGLTVIWAEECLETAILSRSPQEWRIRLSTPKNAPREFLLGLPGDHQADNFGTALLAFEALGERLPDDPKLLEVRPDWKGRCQNLKAPTGGSLVLDGSHTAMGGQALRSFLDQVFPESYRTFLFTCSRDRNPWCYLRGLVRKGDCLLLVQYDHPRLWSASELKGNLLDLGWSDESLPTLEATDQASALKRARETGRGEVAVVCGSLYWVGGVLGDPSSADFLRNEVHQTEMRVTSC